MRLPSSGAVESRAYQKSKIMNPNVYEKHFSIDAGGPQVSDNKAKKRSYCGLFSTITSFLYLLR